MKQRTKNSIAFLVIVLLIVVIGFLMSRPAEIVEVPVSVPVNVPYEIYREPEFRKPPIKQYKPGYVQQMGVLVGDNNETLPLYGKEVRGRRDRYHYYTSTPGDQIYSLPVSMGDRDCMDDIGCGEIYGNESVSVLGKDSTFQAKLYRTDHFF